MPERFPSHLAKLLDSPPPTRDGAWREFVAHYSRLIMSAAQVLGGSYDDVMDRYTFILEHLCRDDCKRLRAYTQDPRAKFTTWLVVVCRRLALDHYRTKYGRSRPGSDVIRLQARRALAATLSSALELEAVAAPAQYQPDVVTEAREVSERLNHAMSNLSAQDRLLVKLRFEDGLSAAEIAQIVHAATPFHIYRRLNAILAELRSALAHLPPRRAQNELQRPFKVT